MTRTLLEPGWRETRRQVNGVNLHVVEAGQEGAPLLILLHGFPEFWWAWRHQITPLAEAGYHVVVPDQCGYNLSDAPQQVADYRLDRLAADADPVGGQRPVPRAARRRGRAGAVRSRDAGDRRERQPLAPPRTGGRDQRADPRIRGS